ncbi:MAG TPA: 30S ribosomal protein S20 [Candidatus Limadaptatus stercoripullorum]|uniref:Small ribosomal subunit protein bS20 n=1 Tax=Candidatus Limadaptatus stercoripullorum TaxID=2840846 RepID=A0A9D1SVR6_9FIRM|nr:30S ribosomal protein S20 [Candidatus Limadaptatus stercoripullorum]
MPNIKSAKKRVLVSKRRNAENTAKKSRVKTAVKKYNAAIAAGDVALAEQLLPATVSVIDRATSDGVFHPNTAARKKATLCRALDKLKKNA